MVLYKETMRYSKTEEKEEKELLYKYSVYVWMTDPGCALS